jgi:molybdate transport system ATP-binding protein
MILSASITKRLSTTFTLAVDVDVAPGITILFGASGSGKTTILRCLAGLMTPDAGRVRVGERVLFDSAARVDVPAQQRHAGFVFQQLALFPHMSVEQNIAYGLHRLSPDVRQQLVSAIAESFRIAHLLDRRPSAISGGERQRAALARALVPDPSFLLLDEPLSGLDHAIQTTIMDDLRRWNDVRQLPILYVTHNHREAYGLGDRVVIVDGGRVLASGSPHEVLDHPGHEVVASLAGFENVFDATVIERREAVGTMQCRVNDSTTELEVPLAGVSAGSIVRIAIRAGDILVANEEPHGLSARNVLRGQLKALTAQGPTMVASVDAGRSFTVHLTRGGVESLGLRPGEQVWLIIKTYSCRIAAR